ncbi:MarR family winged helix-turn-helix transcriptional regulator [Paraburkholderia adhaesiva]|uniref:MarR family winged helix-turn-helix transcriptional regulator n=1 Tax=Paraburkholderia adhaesiva TaxID=2883244 RepID=UPI001F38AA1D|nr:MarR family transcriptional regulator [Paraburkholderia adhaesiva]
MNRTKFLEQLDHARHQGLGRLLLLAHKRFVTQLADRVEQSTPRGKTLPAPGRSLLPYIDIEGTRSTELARRVGVTKQAIGRAVRELEDAGLVTRQDDSADGRAYLVTFTEEGLERLSNIVSAVEALEREYESVLGASTMRHLRRALAEIANG